MDYHFTKTLRELFEVSNVILDPTATYRDGCCNCGSYNFSKSCSLKICDTFFEILRIGQQIYHRFKNAANNVFQGPPQILVDEFPVTNHLVVDKDENAVIVVLFCSDPEPRKTFWEWETFRQETNSNTGRHTADEIQRIPSQDDCYEARLTIHSVEGGDSKTYTFVIENEKGRESFSVALEVRDSSGFKPAPESIVENGCPDNDRADLTTAKTVPYCTNPIIKGKIATIAEDPFYKDGKKADRNDNRDGISFGSLESSVLEPDHRDQPFVATTATINNSRIRVHPQANLGTHEHISTRDSHRSEYRPYQSPSVEQAYI
ncbi:kin of IRRE-like protein 2 [Caerostris darwini]|uniref:Kin of IRRE-like protein 2 n=1 Tax=Caerostris darwini TaxID=1538125 RepID=A0AAV4W0H3_9ARAC|nr:kin of IRRE-like protein 2 [Caerostris darwini]